jgi:SAM-dependent methyltransferase
MALIFTRLAHNFIKNGYYPTDAVTLERILNAIEPAGKSIRILDPCCGEGTALAELARHLQEQDADVESLGVEFDAERAWHAKSLLGRAIHSDLHDVVISPRSVGLLFLNPPYGHGLADKAGTGDSATAERMEKSFLRKTTPLLTHGGVLVYIVPHYVLDKELATFLARHFRELRVYMAPEQQFKQCVVFGIKDRPRHPPQAVLDLFERARVGEFLDQELPEVWSDPAYAVPSTLDDGEFRFHAVRIDPAQLADELARFKRSTLWEGFGSFFGQDVRKHRRPLRDLSQWHLAIALAAGQVTGVVTSPAGRVLLIKGDTHKSKQQSKVIETDEQGNVTEIVTMTDKFVPVINAIEFTPGPDLGRIVTIR